jgi:uncharacterized glyoxalase superfamily protein PhnB
VEPHQSRRTVHERRLGGPDKARLTKIFQDLAAGGQTKMPLTQQPGGVEVGYLLDKFGINWVVSIEKS